MTWFELLTGIDEESPESVRELLVVDGSRLISRANGGNWRCGEFETPSLADLRDRAARHATVPPEPVSVREVVADVQQLTDEQLITELDRRIRACFAAAQQSRERALGHGSQGRDNRLVPRGSSH